MTKGLRVYDEAGQLLLEDVALAATFWPRLKGLMLKRDLHQDAGLLLTKCNAIHCWFMLIPIDVIFLDAEGVVVKVIAEMKPWRFSPIVRSAVSVLECSAGAAHRLNISEGQPLRIQEA